MGPRARSVGHIYGIGEAAQRACLAQQVLGVEGHRRGDLGGHDKPAGPQPLCEGPGEGAAACVVHVQLAARNTRFRDPSAYMLYGRIAINALRPRFVDRKRPYR